MTVQCTTGNRPLLQVETINKSEKILLCNTGMPTSATSKIYKDMQWLQIILANDVFKWKATSDSFV
jgi:hypothetical protein